MNVLFPFVARHLPRRIVPRLARMIYPHSATFRAWWNEISKDNLP